MLSKPLYKQNFKSNLFLLLLFIIVSLAAILAVYELDAEGHTSTEFLSYCLLEIIFLAIPSIYSIALSNRLVTKGVRRKTMSHFLAAAGSRKKMITAQAAYMVTSQAILFCCMTGAGIISGMDQFMDQCGPVNYILLNGGAFALSVCISGICFFMACILKASVSSLFVNGVLIGIFYILHVFSNMGGGLSVLKYATFFTLFQSEGILNGDFSSLIALPILAAAGLLFYLFGTLCFGKKDLPL